MKMDADLKGAIVNRLPSAILHGSCFWQPSFQGCPIGAKNTSRKGERKMYMKGLRATALVAGLITPLAACGSSSTTSGTSAAQPLKGVKIEVAAKWTGVEQDNFLKIAKIFEGETGAKITYTPTGDSLDTFLAPRIQGGDPPDIAVLPQPGLVPQYAGHHPLNPLS